MNILSQARLSTGRRLTSKTRGHTVRGPPEKRRPDGRRARGRFVQRRGEWFSLTGRTAGQCVSAHPPRGGIWASPPVARPARPPPMDHVAAPRASEAEPAPHETPAESGSSTLRVTARTFAPSTRPARPLATERVPAPRAPDGEPSPRDAPVASGSPTLRATARTFAPGQGVRDEDASLPPPTAMVVAPEVLPSSSPDTALPSTGDLAAGQDDAGHGHVEASLPPPRTDAEEPEATGGRVTSVLTLLTRTLVRFFRRRGGLPNNIGLSRRATPRRRGILKTDLGQYFAAGDI